MSAEVITIAKGEPGAPDHRIFDTDAINRHIDESLKALPEGKSVAFIGYADGDGVKGAIVGRITVGGELAWTVLATRPWKGGAVEWGAGLRWSLP